ncbi:hypothetical protein KPATCC21470_8231 [Kitasatospora purpeofusca]
MTTWTGIAATHGAGSALVASAVRYRCPEHRRFPGTAASVLRPEGAAREREEDRA